MNMKRVKRHKVKTEMPETSTSHTREQEVHDLAYYIHDRVELMHQVFSVLKYKELKAIAPACIRNISLDDLQELCTEELLGISSKRLCAILDGADPPSDTESSSPSPPPEKLETISLDSISSDEEILSQSSSKKKKHKHRRRGEGRPRGPGEGEASRAGLTVLELLELQARARAIRAQLQQEQQNKVVSETVVAEPDHSSENEVEIKEEPAEVVEISSDEEKPTVQELDTMLSPVKPTEAVPQTVKRNNELVIIAPQKLKQKIKLNRKKGKVTTEKDNTTKDDTPKTVASTENTEEIKDTQTKKDKGLKKKKAKRKVNKDYDDNDEITLQLSDTEKMDLLEDLDRKNYDYVTSDSCSDSSSESDGKNDGKKKGNLKEEITPENSKDTENSVKEVEKTSEPTEEEIKDKIEEEGKDTEEEKDNLTKDTDVEKKSENEVLKQNTEEMETIASEVEKVRDHEKSDGELSDRESSEVEAVDSKPEVFCISDEESSKTKKKKKKDKKCKKDQKCKNKSDFREAADQNFFNDNNLRNITVTIKTGKQTATLDKAPQSETDNDKPIDNPNSQSLMDNVDLTVDNNKPIHNPNESIDNSKTTRIDDTEIEEAYEIYELSDDSVCEVAFILSKEPTASEIEALSAKIDEIDREEVITEEEIKRYESREAGDTKDKEKTKDIEELGNISWKDRYLDSTKVKKVLNTANMLNALRKKNKDLKKKLAMSKNDAEETAAEPPAILEGSIDQYNTLEGSTKYVCPVVPGDLKKDAKILLKMYKKLLKYNDMNKEKKVKKKKKKKHEGAKDSDLEKVKQTENTDGSLF